MVTSNSRHFLYADTPTIKCETILEDQLIDCLDCLLCCL